jgi:hypothetical protein
LRATNAIEKKKNISPAENQTLAVQPIAIPTEISWLYYIQRGHAVA